MLGSWLFDFAQGSDFHARLSLAFGPDLPLASLQALRAAWSSGDYRLPGIEVIDAVAIDGAAAAYAAATDTILLSAEALASRSTEAVALLLLEEYGHALDHKLNGGADSSGDEGRIFARQVAGPALSEAELAALKAEDDSAVAQIAGADVSIEQADPVRVTFSSNRHVFSINDVLGGFDGQTFADDPTIIDLAGTSGVPVIVDKNGDVLSPIDSEFGFYVQDFVGAEQKVRDNDYAEGWAGNIVVAGQVVGIATVNAVTDTFKSGQPFGTWAAGLGGNSVKAETEHYEVMAYLLSDQGFVGDPGALYPLDNNLKVRGTFEIGGVDVVDPFVTDLLAEVGDVNGDGVQDIRDVLEPNESTTSSNIAYGNDYSVTLKDDGKLLYRWGTEVKRPNDIRMDVKLTLPEEWLNTADLNGNTVPDVLELNGGLGYRVTRAELVVAHNITNNPNDQIRPEDWENEGATGRTPSYYIVTDPDDATNTLWVSVVDSYAGSGEFLPSYFRMTDTGEIDLVAQAGDVAVFHPDGTLAGYRNKDADGNLTGTVYRDLARIDQTDAANLTFSSSDLDGGFTNAWYTTTNREPFEWSYDRFAGTDGANEFKQVYVGFRSAEDAAAAGFTEAELVSGPRWRLTSNKFGQDVPGVEIPLIENSRPPYQSDNIKYEVGTPIVTVLNLLDWADDNGNGIDDDSPLLYSTGWTFIDPARMDLDANGLIDAGWVKVNGTLNAGDALPTGPIFSAVTPNGLTLTPDFLDTAFYLKGDRQDSAKIFNVQLVLEFEADPAFAPDYDYALSSEGDGIFTVDPAAIIPDLGDGSGGGGGGDGDGDGEGGGGGGNATPPQDIDQPLNTAPMFRAVHVFSTADVLGTFDGLTQGRVQPGETPVIDFSATPRVTKEGVELFPINSEFGYIVTDFVGSVPKDFVLNPEYAEGWAGDLRDPVTGAQLGLVVSDSPTDTFKTPALLGTWLVGMGGDAVKADTEHYVVMQQVLSDQRFPGDPDALYPLDDNLMVIGGTFDGRYIAEIISSGDATDVNGDGVIDIRDVLAPNEDTITENIAVSNDYSVTLKDDGKLLYRWGNEIKRPNDIRLEAQLALPTEWANADELGLLPLFKVTQAELVVRHTLTNNPNDQFRPEDYENEAATGTLPEYVINPDGTWVTAADYYAGDGTFYPAGTLLKDPALAAAAASSDLAAIGALSADLLEGFTNAWYTTMNREPFEPVLSPDGTEYEVGPRWRLKADKFGQDLPGVVIPEDATQPPPPTRDEVKYTVGAETQTVVNLLDWEGASPLSISAGWQNKSGTVSENGLNRTQNFDVSFYVKGDQKPVTLYSAELLMSYEEVPIAALGASLTGTAGDDVLAGLGGNTFTGLAGEDMFVLSYGETVNSEIVASTITDFEIGLDRITLVGLEVTDLTLATQLTQSVVGSDLQLFLDGTLLATLLGVTTELNPREGGDFFVFTQENIAAAADVRNDFNGDGTSDVLFRNATSDLVLYWEMNDTALFGTIPVAGAAATQEIVATGDFNGDGSDDIALRDTATGAVENWEMSAGTLGREVAVGSAGSDWAVFGAGDFNGDGTDDILFRNEVSGWLLNWQMENGAFAASVAVGGAGLDWNLVGTGDFNGDGTDDILLRHETSGWLLNWTIQDGTRSSESFVGGAGLDWAVAGTGDFNGDGTDDILLRHTSGAVLNWEMSNGALDREVSVAGASNDWTLVTTGDYNADGTDDVLFQNDASGLVLAWEMAGGTFAASVSIAGATPDWELIG